MFAYSVPPVLTLNNPTSHIHPLSTPLHSIVALTHINEWFYTRVCYLSSSPLFKDAKHFSYSCYCHKFSISVHGRGLPLGGDVFLNPGVSCWVY